MTSAHRGSRKGNVVNIISTNWKSILAFVALVVTNLLAVVVDPNTSAIVPQTGQQWVSAVVTTVVGTFLVWVKSNKAPVKS